MSRSSSYVNADGLKVGFGTRTTDNAAAGNVRTDGLRSEVVKQVASAVTGVATTDVTKPQGDEVPIPAGSIIRAVKYIATVAHTGTGALLNIGIKPKGGTGGTVDGLIKDATMASLTKGSVTVGAGSLVGTQLAEDAYITVCYKTAAFTAGAGYITVEYDLPVA